MEQDMITVREFLKEGCKHNDNEALFCNIEVFKYIYNLSQKTSIKSGNKLSVLLLTMAQKVANNPPQKDVSNCMNNIKNILVKKLLHKSDTLAMYSSNQFLLMLSGSSAAKIQSICHNITAALLPVLEEEGLQLRVNIMQE
jgi:PleD family two-component response regulator